MMNHNPLHHALAALSLSAVLLMLTACEKKQDPTVGVGTQEPAKVQGVNNSDKRVSINIYDSGGLYLNKDIEPRSKGGPWKLVDFYGTALMQDSLDVEIKLHTGIFDSVPSYVLFHERIHFDPVPQHVFTINADYTIDYSLMMVNR